MEVQEYRERSPHTNHNTKKLNFVMKPNIMKYLAAVVLSLALFTACKKSDNKPNTTMTVTSDIDGSWTVNSVSAYSTTANTISISATNTKLNAQLKLGLYDYREGNKTYYIDYSTSTGSLNSATYSSEGHGSAVATSGSVSLSHFTTKTIEGTFSFTGPGGSVSGTFIAPRP